VILGAIALLDLGHDVLELLKPDASEVPGESELLSHRPASEAGPVRSQFGGAVRAPLPAPSMFLVDPPPHETSRR